MGYEAPPSVGRSVVCPTCAAVVGAWCARPGGDGAEEGFVHKDRRTLALMASDPGRDGTGDGAHRPMRRDEPAVTTLR
jgi:hypothetical protein